MKFIYTFFITTFLCLGFGKATAQTVPAGLDTLLTRALDSMHLVLQNKGMGAAVVLSDGTVWTGAAGISSEWPPVDVNTSHIFNIGSVNKTITAAAILQMVDDGLLALNDSLHSWLDTFQYINPNITIRQLLRHQSGIFDVIGAQDYQPVMAADQDSVWQLADVITTFIEPALFAPGAAFSYSNTNYMLLGLIIETVSGMPYHEDIRERFLGPLALTSFNIPPYEPYTEPVAHVWLDTTGDGVPDDAHDFFSNWDSWFSSAGPAGSYFSTPADVANWMHILMRGDLLSPAMMTSMKSTVTTPFPGGTKYGLGIMERNILNQKAWGHGGDAGYSASVWYFPGKDISIAVLNNDGAKNSWTLIPTVSALLKSYEVYLAQSTTAKEPMPALFEGTTFPNPFVESFLVDAKLPEGASEIHFQLTDASGRQVSEKTFAASVGEQRFVLNGLGELSPGTYFLSGILDGITLSGQKVLVKSE
ncbi:MAG: serine hydrolase [Saprospiraceae bacterium]|nr:serine hydrolase [Saprospiraceae bacterium]